MKLLAVGLIVIAFNCTVSLSQQTTTVTFSRPPSTSTSFVLVDGLAIATSHSRLTSRKFPPTNTQVTDARFVAGEHGAVYMRISGDSLLVPMPGGGASGCFSLDLPQRIMKLEEFVPRLTSLQEGDPQQH